jgi:LysR family hydrogen peroxide-inducible transcriptional activator
VETHQLRYFVAVAEAGSFVKAADSEGVAQPTVSQQVQKLEALLGAPLFHRLGRSLRLTPFGELLLPFARETLARNAEIQRRIDDLKRPGAGRIHLGVIPTVLPYFVAPALAALRADHPEIEVRLHEAATQDLLQALRGGSLDLAILALPIEAPEIVCSDLFRDELVAIAPAGHPLAQSDSVDLRGLQQERLLLLREGHCLRDNVLTACRKARAQFETVFESDYLGSIFALVDSGLGVSIVPRMSLEHHARGCVMVPLKQAAFRRIGYAQSKQHFATKAQRTFVAWLRLRAKQGG